MRRSASLSHHSFSSEEGPENVLSGRKNPLCRRPCRLEPLQRVASDRDADAEPFRHGAGRERAVRSGIARDEVAERVGDRFEEGVRQPHRQRRTQCIAQPARVFDDGESLIAGDRHSDRAPLLHQVIEVFGRCPD